MGALTEEQHVASVQRVIVEVHGLIAQEQSTGAYARVCWETDEYQAGAWADPLVGQQNLYRPSYFHTEKTFDICRRTYELYACLDLDCVGKLCSRDGPIVVGYGFGRRSKADY